MRRRKEKLKMFLQEKLQMLDDVQQEIPKNIHKKPPPMPQEYEEEYMEKNLEVVMTIPEEPPNPTVIHESVIRYVMVIITRKNRGKKHSNISRFFLLFFYNKILN